MRQGVAIITMTDSEQPHLHTGHLFLISAADEYKIPQISVWTEKRLYTTRIFSQMSISFLFVFPQMGVIDFSLYLRDSNQYGGEVAKDETEE